MEAGAVAWRLSRRRIAASHARSSQRRDVVFSSLKVPPSLNQLKKILTQSSKNHHPLGRLKPS